MARMSAALEEARLDADELRRIVAAYVLRCFCGRAATHESGRVARYKGRRASWARFGVLCPQHAREARARSKEAPGERGRVRPLPCSALIAKRVRA